jgi:hypothetical protein
MTLFRRIPGEAFVYVVLAAYLLLVAYELRMLDFVAAQST